MSSRRRIMLIKALYSIIYNIVYDLNGGILINQNPDTYTIQTSEFDLNNPVRDGYTFLGWTLNGDNTFVTSSKFGTFGDRKYTAHWNMNVTDEDISNNILNLTIDSSADLNGDGIIDNYSISFIGSSHIEKINLPIKNLITGQRYNLSFTESNNATNGNSSGYYTAMYGFYIDSSKHTELSTIFKEESRSQGGLIAEWVGTNNGYLSVIDGKNLNGPRNISVEFVSTNSTMYWIWDYGLIQDSTLYTYNLSNIALSIIPPKINFNTMKLKDDTTYVASFEIKKYDEKNLIFTFEFDGESGVEFLYYPITGLVSGTKYSITFNHSFTGVFINGNNGTYDYGCGILSDINNAVLASKMNGISSNWLSNLWTMNSVSNSVETVTLSFTANSDTAYWIWNMANVSDGTVATINISITDFSASNSKNEIVDYF